MKLKVIWVGKTKSLPIRELTDDYLARIRRLLPCEITQVRDPVGGRALRPAERIAAAGADIQRQLAPAARVVALDENGRQYTSEAFAGWLETEMNNGTRELVFVIGGPDGLDRELAARAGLTLSLGKMTWTHEMCRALLLEQLYRALCILRKIPYHKGSDVSQ